MNVLCHVCEQMSNDRLIDKFSTTPDWCVMFGLVLHLAYLLTVITAAVAESYCTFVTCYLLRGTLFSCDL